MRRLKSPSINIRGVFFRVVAVCVFGTAANGAPWDGNGTPNEPYLIYDACDMQAIGADSDYWNAHFKLMADIDLSAYTGTSFNIIGNIANTFAGVFDGDGHTISNFTYLSASNYVGIFGYTRNAVIRNLGLLDVNVDGGGGERIGGLVGQLDFHSEMENCYVDGGTVSGYRMVGGLAGRSGGYDCLINNCWSSANVSGEWYVGGLVGENFTSDIYYSYATGSVTGNNRIGGLVGEHSYDKIIECFATGDVIGVGSGSSINFVGGLVGYTRGYPSILESCYATGAVSGRYYVGGLIGCKDDDGFVYDCYAVGSVSGSSNVGGLIGRRDSEATISNSFWDVNSSGMDTSDGGTGKTTAEMQDPNTFLNVGWDFVGEVINGPNDIWDICEGTNYPKLAWQVPIQGDFVCPDGVDINDLAVLCEEWLLEKLSADVAPDGGDGIVNFLDWAVYADGWQSTPEINELVIFVEQWLQLGVSSADIAPAGGDGIVNLPDFAVLAENWLAGF